MPRSFSLVAAYLLASSTLCCGCEALRKGDASVVTASNTESSGKKTLDSERTRYQAKRDPDAIRWLLSHHIRNAMTVAEINGVLGEDGVKVEDDTWIKKGGTYREDDVVYRWGPDRNGRNFYLVFRNGRLVNFEATKI